MSGGASTLPAPRIEERIPLIRGEKVIIDADLAEFYAVATKRLNEQVKRNPERFPRDSMFQLTDQVRTEVVAKCDHLARLKFSKALPYAFTEHGAIMAASVLNTPRAVEMSVFVVRAFVHLRRSLEMNRTLARKLVELEQRMSTHDRQILSLARAIRQLSSPKPLPPKRRIGFVADDAPD